MASKSTDRALRFGLGIITLGSSPTLGCSTVRSTGFGSAPSGGLGASLTKTALPFWMATTVVVGGSFLAQYLARQVEPPKEYFLLAPSTTTMAAQSLASFTSSFWIELPSVTRPTRTISFWLQRASYSAR
uniref:Uncharacterized protein n=1 Tax=Arundo donax TaxID=35708 RepID=A0A0A9HDX1_ARUDO